jgi:glycosyltransferase involved in cell wall biosynthesis
LPSTEVYDVHGNFNVFVSDFQRNAWGYNEGNAFVIPTGIDLGVFRPLHKERTKTVLSIVNQWQARDLHCGFRLWQRVANGLPTWVIGDNPGLSKPARDVHELVDAYNTAGVYLNTTTLSSLPTVIMEAMACGCPVVSTATCLIPEVMIQNGVNGFCSNDESVLRKYCQLLLEDRALAKKIGDAGRETVISKFGLDKFTERWNQLIRKVCP